MRISDWSSDVCSSDLKSRVIDRERIDEMVPLAGCGILLQMRQVVGNAIDSQNLGAITQDAGDHVALMRTQHEARARLEQAGRKRDVVAIGRRQAHTGRIRLRRGSSHHVRYPAKAGRTTPDRKSTRLNSSH